MSRLPNSVLLMKTHSALQLKIMMASSKRFHLLLKYSHLCCFISFPCSKPMEKRISFSVSAGSILNQPSLLTIFMWKDWPAETYNKEWRENRWPRRPSWKYENHQSTDKGGHFVDHCGTGTPLGNKKELVNPLDLIESKESARKRDSPTAVVSNISVMIQKRLTLALYTVNSTKIARVYLSTQMFSKRCWSKLWRETQWGWEHGWQIWIQINQPWCRGLFRKVHWELLKFWKNWVAGCSILIGQKLLCWLVQWSSF